MKFKGLSLLAIFTATLLLWPSAAHTERDVESDPYVQLYKVRVEFATVQRQRQKARVDFERARLERNAVLLRREAASLQEYQEALASYEMNRALLAEMDIRIKEADVLLNLCRLRIESGKDMPLFPVSSNNLDNPFVSDPDRNRQIGGGGR